MAPSYCDLDDIKAAAGRWIELSQEEADAATNMAAAASRMVEQSTGTWFYKRHLQITTEAPGDTVRQLFLPAAVNGALESVTENSSALDLTQVLVYPTWLEKKQSIPSTDPFGYGLPVNYWSQIQQGVVIKGYFGPTSCPDPVLKATAHLAAALLGWITRTYVTGDGVEKAVLNTETLPQWAKDALKNYVIPAWHGQSWMLVDL